MTEQLTLDFTASVSVRQRKAKKLREKEDEQPRLFAEPPNFDVHLHSPTEAIAQISGKEPERAILFLQALVGSVRIIKSRRVAFPTEMLDRLLHLRPPAQVTLDASASAVARAIWAHKIGLKPLKVTRERRHLYAYSPRWPTGFGIRDVPWPAIAALTYLNVPLDIEAKAKNLMNTKLGTSGQTIANAGLAGSAVMFEAQQPTLLEALGLPALSYAGEPRTGKYKMPLLLAECLLSEPTIRLSPELVSAIKKTTSPVKPLELDEDFPWTLYPFQARDAAKAKRILETTGGVLLAGDMGSGKCLESNITISTSMGPVPIGELEVGDQVYGSDGLLHNVTGVYPQGVRPLYRVTFSDRTYLVADEDHLWSVHSPVQKNRGRPGKVKTTRELLDRGLRDAAGNCRWYIDITAPVQFPKKELPVPAYALGVLLGDGSVTGNSVTICDAENDVAHLALADLRTTFPGIALSPVSADKDYRVRDPHAWRGNRLKDALTDLGLWGKRAWEKSVPAMYLDAAAEDRVALLQGLLDTDGGVASHRSPGSIEFTSTSEQLARDVVRLVQSLGGTARIPETPVRKTYTYNGEKKLGRPAWRVSICMPNGISPFRMARKVSEYRPRVKYGPTRAITSIEPVEPGPATCISVDAPDHQYLTAESYILAHNTTVSLGLVHDMDIWPLLVVAPLSAFSTWQRQLEQMNKKAYLATENPKKSWEEIESRQYEAVVISYDRLPAFVELIERYGFKGIAADELQRIRTPTSRRSRALRQLASAVPFRIGMSGTPISNYLSDILPLGAWLAPSEWKPRASNKEMEDLYPGDPLESVADHLSALQVRRRMQDTGATLPKRNDHRVYIQLTPEQRRAIADMEAEAEAAKDAGEFDDPSSKIHAFAKLQRMRQIVNCPAAVGIGGPNPKVQACLDLAEDFLDQGRKGVIFCADRTTFQELGKEMDKRGIGWVGIWGSTPSAQRIENEKMFHRGDQAPNGHPTSVVLCTIQAGSESWSASPTGTWLISTAYVYAPATLSQMECRVYRMNSDPDGPDIEICYIHAQAPGGSLDDRMVEILNIKKELFAQVVDRTAHVDTTKVHYSMSDLVYLMTGVRDEGMAKREADAKAVADREQAMKDHAKQTLYKNKGKNKTDVNTFKDRGDVAKTFEEMVASGEIQGYDDTHELDELAESDTLDLEGLFEDDPDKDEDDFFSGEDAD